MPLHLPKVRPLRLSKRVQLLIRPASSPLYYITALTALFESIALIVDQHQPVVEKYYGPGKMSLVLERLLRESDRVVKDLLDGWEDERSVKRKVSHIIAQNGCPANGRAQLSDISSVPTSAGIQRQTSSAGELEDDAVDPREIDKVLTEAAGMSGRWGLFRKFMHDRLKVTILT